MENKVAKSILRLDGLENWFYIGPNADSNEIAAKTWRVRDNSRYREAIETAIKALDEADTVITISINPEKLTEAIYKAIRNEPDTPIRSVFLDWSGDEQTGYTCPLCRSPINEGDRFCSNCGDPLDWSHMEEDNDDIND